MIIGVTGYGGTGASAYTALFKEFEGTQLNWELEFQLLQEPDGILDLEYALVHSKSRIRSNAAIKRFIKNLDHLDTFGKKVLVKATNGVYVSLSKEYINKLIDTRWLGRSNFDPTDLQPSKIVSYIYKVRRAINRFLKLEVPECRSERYYSLCESEKFSQITKKYLEEVVKACGFDLTKNVFLEQLFTCTNPLDGSHFFDEVKSIVVDRDPRDIYIQSNYLLNKHYFMFMPNSGSVDEFIKYYRLLHSHKVDAPNVLYVNFEDLMYRYDDTAAKMCDFLGSKHINKRKYFHPEKSINNTMLYKRYPKMRAEIEKIEKELSEYLYDFDKYANNLDYTPEVIDPAVAGLF